MTKEQLRRYAAIKREQQQIKALLAELETSAAAPGGALIFAPGRRKGVGGSLQEKKKTSALDLQRLYRQKIRQLQTAQLRIEKAIGGLDPDMQILMRAKYIEEKSWEEVSSVIGYSLRQTHRLHAKALQAIKTK